MSEILLDPQTLAAIESFDERFEGAEAITDIPQAIFQRRTPREELYSELMVGFSRIALGDELD